MSTDPQFLTPQEVSHLLRMPVTSVYDLARKSKLPGAFKVGRHWRFSDKVLTEWLDVQMGVALEKATGSLQSKNVTQSKNILVIEDDDLVLSCVCKALEAEGFTAVGAKSGPEGVEKVQTGPWDLILCDIRMKDQDGVEAVKQICDSEKKSCDL